MSRLARIVFAALTFAAGGSAPAQTRPADALPTSAPTTTPTTRPLSKPTVAAHVATRAAKARIEQVRANLAAVQEILDIGLANDDAGELLREARRRAPDPEEMARRVALRKRQIAEARLERVRLLERRRLAENPAEIARLTDELNAQEAHLAALTEALAAEQELANEAAELVTLLEGRLLWIGSAPPIGPTWVADVTEGVAWLASPQSWLEAAQTLLRRFADATILSSLVTLLVGLLIILRPRLRSRRVALAEKVGKYATDSFAFTVQALANTLLLAVPVPLALGSVGLLLSMQSLDPFARAIGNGLLAAAAVYLLIDFFLLMCQPKGLADAHFGWDERARRTLLNNLRWLLAVVSPAALIVAACEAGGHEVYRQGIGRLAFMVGSVGTTLFVARVFRPGSGVFAGLMSPDGWAWKFRKLWYGLLVLLPAALTIAAAAGYYYTATEVQSRYFTTGVAVLVGVVVYSLLTRLLLVTRRRLAIQQARQKLAEQREARQRKDAAGAPGEALPELETQTVDIAAASGRTLALLRTIVAACVLATLWALWKNLLPALTILQRVELTEPTVNAAGEVIAGAVTLWSLLLGMIALVLTGVAARNLPAVLELVVLERFTLDAGVRYAAATLTRYAVIAAGIVIASNLLGINWSRAQWIIAALGVGLGFGLQEIVANFVSGLIILFERPVRVGDAVTVGDISGTVSRIQIRATTITDWENKEVLVPNKSFITDRVVNWTLSNSTTRLLIRVGVAYGSDVAKAQEVITAAVQSVPAVLAEPVPSVLFVAFGESSLDFEVRVFVGELSKRLPTTHELHSAINIALANAKIEIPFPQRDLHLRTSDIGRLAPAKPEEDDEPPAVISPSE